VANVCGSVSAIGLEQQERQSWPYLRERLRQPGYLMALMRGVLGDTEVAVVTAVTPRGAVTPLAILTTSEEIAQELVLSADRRAQDGVRRAKIGDDDVDVVVDESDGSRPLAILVTPWIEQHLLVFARTLWRGR
jgi:hypothetical protein